MKITQSAQADPTGQVRPGGDAIASHAKTPSSPAPSAIKQEVGGQAEVEQAPDDDGLGFLREQEMSGVDTSMPILVEGLYNLEVVKVEIKPGAKDPSKKNLSIQFKLKQTGKDTAGNEVQEGFPLFHTVSLTPTDKYPQDKVVKAVAQLCQAAGFGRLFPLDQWPGALVTAKVKVQQERTDKETGESYDAGNRIKMFVVPDNKTQAEVAGA